GGAPQSVVALYSAPIKEPRRQPRLLFGRTIRDESVGTPREARGDREHDASFGVAHTGAAEERIAPTEIRIDPSEAQIEIAERVAEADGVIHILRVPQVRTVLVLAHVDVLEAVAEAVAHARIEREAVRERHRDARADIHRVVALIQPIVGVVQ